MGTSMPPFALFVPCVVHVRLGVWLEELDIIIWGIRVGL